MSSITGAWRLRMKTPIGTIEADYDFTDTSTGISGTASRAGEHVVLHDIVCEPGPDGERVTWRQSITEPLRSNLEFDVTVTGDTLTGHSRAGRLPRSKVTGERIGA
ncbi:hypothetical protein [Nocardia higoensis]|uniref:hypothetical protein n=1 Tax=Nocardia higoensis TaxID=228599 RepID=UPI0002E0DB0E|nr:hypothetical protein [Nocardia higoensis]